MPRGIPAYDEFAHVHAQFLNPGCEKSLSTIICILECRLKWRAPFWTLAAAGTARSPPSIAPALGSTNSALEEAAIPHEQRTLADEDDLDERFNRLECARLAALAGLLRLPAPDLPALALKIALIVDEAAWELTDPQPCLAALKADARPALPWRIAQKT